MDTSSNVRPRAYPDDADYRSPMHRMSEASAAAAAKNFQSLDPMVPPLSPARDFDMEFFDVDDDDVPDTMPPLYHRYSQWRKRNVPNNRSGVPPCACPNATQCITCDASFDNFQLCIIHR